VQKTEGAGRLCALFIEIRVKIMATTSVSIVPYSFEYIMFGNPNINSNPLPPSPLVLPAPSPHAQRVVTPRGYTAIQTGDAARTFRETRRSQQRRQDDVARQAYNSARMWELRNRAPAILTGRNVELVKRHSEQEESGIKKGKFEIFKEGKSVYISTVQYKEPGKDWKPKATRPVPVHQSQSGDIKFYKVG
jgi:hypothetical protein